MHDEYDDNEQLLPSKTQLKREAHDLFKLGESLVALDSARLDRIEMDSKLREAIDTAKKIRKHGGLKRQLLFIGKLLRGTDAEAIRHAYDETTHSFRQDNRRFHQVEQWRDRLLDENDDALPELIDLHPQLDRQHLRNLVRQASRERSQNKPPKSARELFKYLRSLFEQQE